MRLKIKVYSDPKQEVFEILNCKKKCINTLEKQLVKTFIFRNLNRQLNSYTNRHSHFDQFLFVFILLLSRSEFF